MNYTIAIAFQTTFDGYAETSSLDLLVKFGDEFDKVLEEVESSVPHGYILNSEIQVFADGTTNDDLTLIVRERVDAAIKQKNELRTKEEMEG